jgi:UDP-2,4-diacetamido-2,4,6-trideoxy-beta-L-altropyranose hydrolase
MRIIFRVDASREIGAGHVVRCLALAQALTGAGCECTFVCARLPMELEAALRAERVRVLRIVEYPAGTPPHGVDVANDAEATLTVLAREAATDCVVVDHYGLDAAWESRLRARATRILVIDDLADRRHNCDWLLDQNLQPVANRYRNLVPDACRQILGPRFSLLRPTFAGIAAGAVPLARRSRVLVAAGGGDAANVTGTILEAWRQVRNPRPPLDVVIGAMHPHVAAIRSECDAQVDVQLHVQTERMAELLAQARMMIGAAGTVSWERCCLGVPALMFAAAGNQSSNLRLLAAARTGISLGDANQVEPVGLARMATRVLARQRLLERLGRRAATLVDGHGARRVALLLAGERIALRAATSADAQAAWRWRNHPATRRVSRDSREIPFDQHREWWLATLANPQRRLYVAHCGTMDVGVLRLDLAADSAEISIYLDPALNGLGLGPSMLRAAQRAVSAGDPDVRRMRADILPGNRASESAFTRAGFRRDGATWVWSNTNDRIEQR